MEMQNFEYNETVLKYSAYRMLIETFHNKPCWERGSTYSVLLPHGLFKTNKIADKTDNIKCYIHNDYLFILNAAHVWNATLG
jgi:hypothetical protein